MISGMATSAPRSVRDLRRDPEHGKIAGVCEGLGKRLQVDPLLIRIGFVAFTLASGVGLVLYVLAWILMPAEKADSGTVVGAIQDHGRRGTVEVALGAGLLLLSVLLAFRELGLPFSDVLIWPLTLVAAGSALIWHRSTGTADPVVRPAVSPREGATAVPVPERGTESRPAVISRIGIGVVLVVAAAIVFLQFTGALAAATDVALAALVVAIAFGVIFAPWIVRLGKSLTAERYAGPIVVASTRRRCPDSRSSSSTWSANGSASSGGEINCNIPT